MLRELLLLAGLSCLVMANDVAPPIVVDGTELTFASPDERNAALYYLQATMVMQDYRAEKIIKDWTDTKLPPPDEAEQAKAAYLDFLHIGAAMPRCTFGAMPIFSKQGVNAIGPMVSSGQTLSRLALARAEWRFRHGHIVSGLSDVRDIAAFGRHFTEFSTLIGYLVGLTLQSEALSTASRHLPRFDEASKRTLAAILRSDAIIVKSPGIAALPVELAAMQTTYQRMMEDPKPIDAYRELVAISKKGTRHVAMNAEEKNQEEQGREIIRTELALSPEQRQALFDEMKSLWLAWDALVLQPAAVRIKQVESLHQRERAFAERSPLLGMTVPAIGYVIGLYRRNLVQRQLLAEICELPDLDHIDSLAGRETLYGELTVQHPAPNQITLTVPREKNANLPLTLLTLGGWLDQKSPDKIEPKPADEEPKLPEKPVNF